MTTVPDPVPVLDVTIHQKQTFVLEVQLLNSLGVPINVESASCWYDIFDISGGGTPVLSKTEADGVSRQPDGILVISLSEADTASLQVPVSSADRLEKKYRHNLMLEAGGETVKGFQGTATVVRTNAPST